VKIFLSWSKDLSHNVAEYFAEWLPSVIQECKDPFISSDIDKGEPWFETITSSLASTDLGLVFITPDNQESTWLNFEAGAMINKFGKSGVCPILVDLKKGNYDGPMKNLQLSELDSEQDMKQLLVTINKKCSNPLDAALLDRMFGLLWEDLRTKVQELIAEHRKGRQTASVVRSTGEKLDELLTLARGMAANDSRRTEQTLQTQSIQQEMLALLMDDRARNRYMDDESLQHMYALRIAGRENHHDVRMKRFVDKYGSLYAKRNSDGQKGVILDFAEKNGKLHSVRFQADDSEGPERLEADEVEVMRPLG
jgi:hypothetical protein